MTGSDSPGGHGPGRRQELTVELDEFGWEALEREAASMKVSVEQLVAFAVIYYLADVDSGRIARRVPTQDMSPRA